MSISNGFFSYLWGVTPKNGPNVKKSGSENKRNDTKVGIIRV